MVALRKDLARLLAHGVDLGHTLRRRAFGRDGIGQRSELVGQARCARLVARQAGPHGALQCGHEQRPLSGAGASRRFIKRSEGRV